MFLSSKKKTKKVFISFDYDNDRNYRYLLSALKANSGSDIDFEDLTPDEIQSYNVGRIKAALTRRIKNADYTLVIIGKHANSHHPDKDYIGVRVAVAQNLTLATTNSAMGTRTHQTRKGRVAGAELLAPPIRRG